MLNLKERIIELTGNFEPEKHIVDSPNFQILSEYTKDDITYKQILIPVDKEDVIPAFILIPNKRKKLPGILALHQTTEDPSIGAEETVGLRGNQNYSYAIELAKMGFVTISPDYPFFGNYKTSTEMIYDKFGYESVTMKGIINHIASINILVSLPQVDSARIGCIGHSLGGTNTLFSYFFDKRIKAAVVSAGFTTFASYAKTSESGDLEKWALTDKYMPNTSLKYKNDPSKMPFDFPELLASFCPKPIFVSTPQEDEIFDFSGAMDCVGFALEKYELLNKHDKFKYIQPKTNHDFPDDARKSAYQFLEKELKLNG